MNSYINIDYNRKIQLLVPDLKSTFYLIVPSNYAMDE